MKGRSLKYSDEELAWVEANKVLPRRELYAAFQARFDRPDVAQSNLTALCKRKGWFTGRDGKFAKGHVSHNKGKAMPYHPNSAATQFKKGRRPHTWRGPGHERTDKEGYVWLIVAERNPHTGADTRSVMKHRWLWEQKNGPVPKGHVLKCIDGDKANTDPLNWIAIPRSMLPRLAGRWHIPYDEAPDDLKPTLMAIARLEQEARDARKARS